MIELIAKILINYPFSIKTVGQLCCASKNLNKTGISKYAVKLLDNVKLEKIKKTCLSISPDIDMLDEVIEVGCIEMIIDSLINHEELKILFQELKDLWRRYIDTNFDFKRLVASI